MILGNKGMNVIDNDRSYSYFQSYEMHAFKYNIRNILFIENLFEISKNFLEQTSSFYFRKLIRRIKEIQLNENNIFCLFANFYCSFLYLPIFWGVIENVRKKIIITWNSSYISEFHSTIIRVQLWKPKQCLHPKQWCQANKDFTEGHNKVTIVQNRVIFKS
jgi:hypothetical protein